MESVCIKLEDNLARQIDKLIKELNYSTKSEFIRETLRNRVNELSEKKRKDEAWDRLLSMKGAWKGKGKFKTPEDLHNWRASREAEEGLEEYLNKKMGLTKK